MRSLRLIPLVSLLSLAACSYIPLHKEAAPLPARTSQADFHDMLAGEYSNLAVFARNEMNDEVQALRFEVKAKEAAAERLVLPENPDTHRLPIKSQHDLVKAYDILADALTYMSGPENSPLLAMAQTHYDCWMMTEENYRGSAVLNFPCRDDFEASISQLAMPQNDKYRFDIRFPGGMASVEGSAMTEIHEAADHFSNRALWTIVLSSYADGKKTSREPGENLPMRRAIAVKNALAQQGIGQERLLIRVGTAPPENPAMAGTVEISFLPDYTAEGMDMKSHPAPGWDHSGDDF